MFKKWLYVAGEININIDNVKEIGCPVCGQKEIDYLYIGDEASREGYMHVWCNNCLNGIQISRTIIPPNAKMLSFDSLYDIPKFVPKYKKVAP